MGKKEKELDELTSDDQSGLKGHKSVAAYSGRPPSMNCDPYSHPLSHLFHTKRHLYDYKHLYGYKQDKDTRCFCAWRGHFPRISNGAGALCLN